MKEIPDRALYHHPRQAKDHPTVNETTAGEAPAGESAGGGGQSTAGNAGAVPR